MNREQAKYHFMAVAPPVPDWFEPDMVGHPDPRKATSHVVEYPSGRFCSQSGPNPKDVRIFMVEYEKQKLLQWPAYYAEEMLKRADK